MPGNGHRSWTTAGWRVLGLEHEVAPLDQAAPDRIDPDPAGAVAPPLSSDITFRAVAAQVLFGLQVPLKGGDTVMVEVVQSADQTGQDSLIHLAGRLPVGGL